MVRVTYIPSFSQIAAQARDTNTLIPAGVSSKHMVRRYAPRCVEPSQEFGELGRHPGERADGDAWSRQRQQRGCDRQEQGSVLKHERAQLRRTGDNILLSFRLVNRLIND